MMAVEATHEGNLRAHDHPGVDEGAEKAVTIVMRIR